MAVTPITWRIVEPPRARDGDSVYLVREREFYRDDVEVLIRRDARPVLCRLTWLACPEISGPNKDPINGPRATADAQEWLDGMWRAKVELTAVQYGFEKYGRPLVDVRGNGEWSLSIWMTATKGWEVYAE
jgi:endonuclease YncB( thermonuclease family)